MSFSLPLCFGIHNAELHPAAVTVETLLSLLMFAGKPSAATEGDSPEFLVLRNQNDCTGRTRKQQQLHVGRPGDLLHLFFSVFFSLKTDDGLLLNNCSVTRHVHI